MLRSPWKITLLSSPAVVLLDYAELIDDEIDWGGARMVQVVPLLRAASPAIRNRKNISYQIQFTVQRKQTTDALGAAALLDSLIEFGTMEVQELKVERYGLAANYWKFSKAAVTAWNAKGRTVGLGMRKTVVNITAAGFSKV